ncbi:MAG: hypothetical protein ACI97A_001256 [Planctomycetota bacterium]
MKIEEITDHSPHRDPAKLKIGVSACLLGNEVRYDGGHKRARFLTDVLAPFVNFVPVCPEVELGLGVPRETLRLEVSDGETRLVAPGSQTDHTESMTEFSNARVEELAKEELCGFVLMKNSPSCGLFRVKRYPGGKSMPTKDGRGLFAEALQRRFPSMPIEEDGRLNDPVLRESFLERAYALARIKELFARDWRRRDLVEFHTKEKLLLMAHSPAGYKKLGNIVGEMDRFEPEELERVYIETFMAALSEYASVGRHVNVLQHMVGYFTDALSPKEKAELHGHIVDYKKGIVPILVPLVLIRHCVSKFDVTWLSKQSYLEPQPNELMLRTTIK